MSEEILRKLLSGAEEMSRMQKEVERIAKMLIGFLPANLPREVVDKEISVLGFYCWWFHTTPQGYELSFCKWHADPEGGYKERLYSATKGIPSLKHTQLIHGTLSLLLEGAIKKFPFMPNKWQPLIEAAKS